MQKNILIIGGKGLVGKTIYRILKSRNPDADLFVGSRKATVENNELTIDVNQPDTFQSILDKKIDIIVLSVNDNEDNVLHFAVKHHLDYIDITKPTPALMKAYHSLVGHDINSRIVFASGWMGGIIAGLIKANVNSMTDIEKVDVAVYYSVKDLAGEVQLILWQKMLPNLLSDTRTMSPYRLNIFWIPIILILGLESAVGKFIISTYRICISLIKLKKSQTSLSR
ncbi:hypothetical protein [Sphingobacterium sp. IITKGP-BTPF85]|uniref:hypothetical protein n=1 Tax=Sphingobacterium sp. IITKGP-BTPF85 TaxID=1338009 RepID=UPI0003FC8D1C|nr:hypothetical protein [Sphingobacterium sp. IITKGP-BTPF85]KKX51312.1 hypothetical protein L950_0205355 [Sphingobacterium sp. IITKGP-BTPF85]